MHNCFCESLKIEGLDGSSFTGGTQYVDLLNALEKHAFVKLRPAVLYSEYCDEDWFQCPKCGQIWRLVYPELPFAGLWEKVPPQNIP